MITTISNKILFALAFFLTINANSQDLVGTELHSETASKWKLGFNNSVGIATQKATFGKWEGEWYRPGLSFSNEITVSRKLKDQFFLGVGCSFDYYRIKSESYVYSGTVYHYYGPGPIGYLVTSYDFTDDSERYSQRTTGYVSIPLTFEYYSENKIGFYGKVGVHVSFPVFYNSKNLRTSSKEEIINDPFNLNEPTSKIYNRIGTLPTSMLFAQYGFGLQLKTSKTIGTFGLRLTHGLTKLNEAEKREFPHALRFEIGIQRELSAK